MLIELLRLSLQGNTSELSLRQGDEEAKGGIISPCLSLRHTVLAALR